MSFGISEIATIDTLDAHITIYKPVVIMCTVGKITTKSMVFYERKEVNHAKLMYVVLATQSLFFFLFC